MCALLLSISLFSVSASSFKVDVSEYADAAQITVYFDAYPEIVQKPSIDPNNILVWTFSHKGRIREKKVSGQNTLMDYLKVRSTKDGDVCLIINTYYHVTYTQKVVISKSETRLIINIMRSNNIPDQHIISFDDIIDYPDKYIASDLSMKKEPHIEIPGIIKTHEKSFVDVDKQIIIPDTRLLDEKDNDPEIELVFLNQNKKKDVVRSQHQTVVVVDAGHGGKDPGAISPHNMYEKDVTLDIALKVKELFESRDDVTIVLTRDKDEYLSLGRRRKIAKRAGASLFVSIHADASENPAARGSSVFVLSKEGSVDEISKIIAKSHDSVEKEFGNEIATDDSTVMGILLDLKNSHNSKESGRLGRSVLNYMVDLLNIRSRGLRSAPFSVLKLLNVPSILVETAFLSNKYDEQLLRSEKFRMKMAYCIYNGIIEYLYPAKGSKPAAVVHKVKKGDNLWNISRKYSVNINSIVKVNKLRSDLLRPESKIIIPYY